MKYFSRTKRIGIYHLKSRLNIILIIISLISLLFVFLNLIGFLNVLSSFQLVYLNYFFQITVIVSTIYVILFLPTYPIFLVFLKKKDYNLLEKLSLTIVVNLSIYILMGYLGYYMGFPLTGIFFFIVIFFFFSSIIICLIYLEFKQGKINFIKSTKSKDEYINIEEFSLFNYVKKLASLNQILLISFIGLVCLLYVVKFSYFYGTDAMLHIFIIKKIKYFNYLPVEEYYGSVGFHIFGAIIHFFSGIDIIFIPKYFVFYTYTVSALIFYNLQKRLFKNTNIAVLGVFILEFFAIGFDHLMYQFWPTSLTVIQCLLIFFLLYIRFKNLIKLERPSKEVIFSSIKFNYFIIFLIFLSAILTHALIAVLFLLSYIFIYFIYFLRDFTRGFDLIFLLGLLGMFLAFYYFYFTSNFFYALSFNRVPIFVYLLAGIIGIYLIWKIKNSIRFTRGRYSLEIIGKKHPYYKKIEDKYIIPISFIIIAFFIILFSILNILLLDLNISKSFLGLETVILVMLGFWGMILYQKKPKGKILIIWGYSIAIIFLMAFIVDIYGNVFISGRIAILASPFIAIAFVSYIYKLIQINKIGKPRVSLFIITIVCFSFFAYFYDQIVDLDAIDYNFQKREIYTARWLSEYTNDKNVIITEFGGNKVFFYYDYPFEGSDIILGSDIHYFLLNVENYFPPDMHINETTGDNILQEIKKEYNTNVYIILDEEYEIMSGWDFIGKLTREQIEQYNSMDYLNKISSTKSEYGVEIPYFWVI